MLSLQLNRHETRSLYQQIAEEIKTRISDGRLPAGARLPTVRKLAEELQVTRLTIQSAYAELQADGWIEGIVGRGTFVSNDVKPVALHDSVGVALTSEGILSDILTINRVLGMRSMAIAEPDAALFPIDEFWGYLTRLRPKAADLLGYGDSQGDPDLRIEVVRELQELEIDGNPSDVVITNGVMQGLNLVTQALSRPGGTVIVEQPTFIGYLNILKSQGLQPLPVHLDEEGPRLDEFEALAARERPAFFYAIPNFHNPTGRSWSMQRRHDILQIAGQYGLPILEDDIYGRIAYDTSPAPTLKSLDRDDRVFYMSGYSKVFMPGLRLGYLLPPRAFREQILMLRRSADVCGSGVTQRGLAHFLRDNGLKRHLRRVLPIYRQRRDTILQSLRREMPSGVSWTEPEGGFSTWLTLPRFFGRGELYRRALKQRFAFTAGEAYDMDDADELDHLRLCYGNQRPEGIEAGVKLLAQLISNH